MTYYIPKIDRSGKRRAKNIKFGKTTYNIHPYIGIAIYRGHVRLLNTITGVLHLFEDGNSMLKLTDKELNDLKFKLETEYEERST